MSTVRAGFARRDITQPIGTPAQLSLFLMVDEIWDPLTATACVLESGSERVAVVGLDLSGLLEASHHSIRERVAAATGIPPDRIVLNASHSHSAPYISAAAQAELRPFGLRLMDDAYADLVAERVAEAVVEAADRAAPASFAVARGRVEHVASNRRPKLNGRTVHRFGRPPEELRALPEGLIDPDVAVIGVRGADGRHLGALMTYACHPTAAGGGNQPFASADFVGHGRALLEHGFGSTFLFLQGCAGNQGTGKWIAGSQHEDVVAMGERFARGAAAAMEALRATDGDGISVGVESVPLELDPFPPIAEMEATLATLIATEDFGPIMALVDGLVVARRLEELRHARLTAVTFGPDLALVALPGEVFLEHGLAIRAGSPFRETIVSAYNDNTLQYMPTADAFPEGAYEVNGGWRYIQAGEGERMAAEGVRLLERLAAGVR